MRTVTVARHAMNTRFEILLPGEDVVRLRAAGEVALDEIERLDAQLSLFRPASEIRRINRHAAEQPVRVSPPVFRLLQQARTLWQETAGAFDPTVGPLVRAWGFLAGSGRRPEPSALAEARSRVGLQQVELRERDGTVRFAQPGIMLDLGAIGKGYAIDCAVETLRENGVTGAFLHGGTSSVYGLGRPSEGETWKTALCDARRDRVERETSASSGTAPPGGVGLDRASEEPTRDRNWLLAEIPLCDESLGVSAVWGRSFVAEGTVYGHVIDPRTGEPVQHAVLAAVRLPSATETDALSTALLTLGRPGLEVLSRQRPGARLLLAERWGAPLEVSPFIR